MDASNILKSVSDEFPDYVLDTKIDSDVRLNVYIDPEHVKEICQYLKDKLSFDHLSGETAVDYIKDNVIEVVYLIASYNHPVVLALKAKLPRASPEIESIVEVYWNANWYEREVYELFGVKYINHPDLRNLVLPEEMLGEWPLRKDYGGFPNKTAKNLV